jgi:hypothetical protein
MSVLVWWIGILVLWVTTAWFVGLVVGGAARLRDLNC